MKKFILIFVLCLFSVNLFSQTNVLSNSNLDEDGNTINQNEELAIIKNVLANNNNNNNNSQNKTVQASSSSVFITQVGDSNVSIVKVASPNHNVNLNQSGNYNTIDLDLKADKITTLVNQSGDNNLVIDYSFGANKEINNTFRQKGNNLTIEKFGTNSFTDDIQINMTGTDRTVIVRSYK